MAFVAAAADAGGTRNLIGGSFRVNVCNARGQRRLKSGPIAGSDEKLFHPILLSVFDRLAALG